MYEILKIFLWILVLKNAERIFDIILNIIICHISENDRWNCNKGRRQNRQKSVYTHKFLINTYRKKIECAGDWTSCMHNVHRVECSIGSIPRPSFCLQWYLNTSESYNAKSSKYVVQNIVSAEEKISWQRNQCCKIWECWYRIRG